MSKTLYMETTDVPAERTAMEIVAELQGAGCSSINHRYDNGKIIGLSFRLTVKTNGRSSDLEFDLPVRVEPVFQTLKARKQFEPFGKQLAQLKAKSERVAWRQLYRWVQAQLAMIQLGMVQTHEVFMPYCAQPLPNGGRQTLFESFNNQLLLEAPAHGGPA